MILEGGLDVVLTGRTHGCQAGCVETKPAGERHANLFGGRGARVLVVEPSPDAAELLRPAAGLLDAPHCFMDPFAGMLASRLAAEVRSADELADLAIEGLVLELLAHCARRATGPPAPAAAPRWLLQARELLSEGFREPLRVATVARTVGVHPAYLARRFRSHFGTTMAGYVRILRLEWATRRLTDGDDAIASIAMQAGFADQSSLTRCLRAQLGITPGQLRRSRRPQ